MAYGVVFAGDPSKEKVGNFTWHKEVLGFLIANLKFAVQSASSYGRVRKAVQTRKKTLSIPGWLNDAAESARINFSGVLQDVLKEKLHLA